jgi:hypothetical protein
MSWSYVRWISLDWQIKLYPVVWPIRRYYPIVRSGALCVDCGICIRNYLITLLSETLSGSKTCTIREDSGVLSSFPCSEDLRTHYGIVIGIPGTVVPQQVGHGGSAGNVPDSHRTPTKHGALIRGDYARRRWWFEAEKMVLQAWDER